MKSSWKWLTSRVSSYVSILFICKNINPFLWISYLQNFPEVFPSYIGSSWLGKLTLRDMGWKLLWGGLLSISLAPDTPNPSLFRESSTFTRMLLWAKGMQSWEKEKRRHGIWLGKKFYSIWEKIQYCWETWIKDLNRDTYIHGLIYSILSTCQFSPK